MRRENENSMLKKEWAYLKKHKFTAVVLCALILIPSIYAVTFLNSLWHPYQQTEHLPVAVVNKDQTVNYQNQKIDMGHQLTKELKDSDKLNFHEVKSEHEAKQDLRNCKYYMVLTIPKDFSQNLTTAFTNQPKKMKLRYDTNPGQNFIADKMIDSAMKTIEANVSSKVSHLYVQTIIGQVNQQVNQSKNNLQAMMAANPQIMMLLAENAPGLLQQVQSMLPQPINLNNHNFDQMAKPIKVEHHHYGKAPNNGTGMTPYMFAVSLFIGAIALNVLFDLYTPRSKPTSIFAWYGSKLSIKVVYAVFSTLIMLGLTVAVDGLHPMHPFETWLVLLITALCFVAIVTALTLALGRVGEFISICLLVLQLSGSAGTYPIELSSPFFKAINPYLPMTYAIRALRHTIMMGGSFTGDIIILLIIMLVFTSFTFLYMKYRVASFKDVDITDSFAVMQTRSKYMGR